MAITRTINKTRLIVKYLSNLLFMNNAILEGRFKFITIFYRIN